MTLLMLTLQAAASVTVLACTMECVDDNHPICGGTIESATKVVIAQIESIESPLAS